MEGLSQQNECLVINLIVDFNFQYLLLFTSHILTLANRKNRNRKTLKSADKYP